MKVYIAIEHGEGGPIITGTGVDEAEALESLNANASEHTEPPEPFASMQAIVDASALDVASYIITNSQYEFYKYIEEHDLL